MRIIRNDKSPIQSKSDKSPKLIVDHDIRQSTLAHVSIDDRDAQK